MRVVEDLQVPAVLLVLAGVPGVVAALGPDADPGRRDQRPVELDVRPPLNFSAFQHIGKVRGVLGDVVDGLVEVPVPGRFRDGDVARGGVDEGRVL